MNTYAAFGSGIFVGIILVLFIMGSADSVLEYTAKPAIPFEPIKVPPVIKVAYMPGMKPIYQAHPGEWYDLRARKDVRYRAGDTVCIPLGVSMELPRGYEAKVEPRSSTSRKYGLSYSDSGVIDNQWREEWGSTWIATRDGVVRKNTRICQFRLQEEQPPARVVVVDQVEKSERGGYGSTGES